MLSNRKILSTTPIKREKTTKPITLAVKVSARPIVVLGKGGVTPKFPMAMTASHKVLPNVSKPSCGESREWQ